MARSARKLDTETVRQAASGRWPEILERVAGIPGELLDASREHPCPKCGGETRFRLVDEAAGAVLCSHCFAKKNGDGFAAVGWMLNVSFAAAKERVADYLGVAAGGQSDPAEKLEWRHWSSELAKLYCLNKPGVTDESLQLCGARMAMHYGKKVIALPVIGLESNDAVGWVLVGYDGKASVPKYDAKTKQLTYEKSKLTYGSKEAGLLGMHGMMRLKVEGLPELVWKVEGISDLLALQAIIPEQLRDRHLVVTNPKGSKETPKWQTTLLAKVNCNILHDADEPGQAGAEKWARDTASQAGEGVIVRNVRLPYEVTGTKGKDLRDWLAEGHSSGELLSLAEACPPVKVARTDDGHVDLAQARYPIQERILQKLQLEVLLEDEEGRVRVFSTFLRKSSWIRRIEWLKTESMIQICGPPAMEHISTDPDGEETFSMVDVRRALSLAASNRRGKHDDRGVGVWQGMDERGNETNTIVLVNDTEAARWNGDQILRRVLVPRVDGLVLDFGAGHADWFDFGLLDENLERAKDIDWRKAAIEDACKLFSRWRWKTDVIDDELSPLLMTGLVMASWIQTVWSWRPLIAVIGESNSGKSMLLEALAGTMTSRGLFGNLEFRSAKSSEPGVRQGIGNTGLICLLDEFEKSKHRERILEMFRASTRGETVAMGTAGNQKGLRFTLRHISWIAATESGMKDQPDINRFIQLDLLTAEKSKHNQLTLPGGDYLQALGQRLLAIAVRFAIESKALAIALKSTRVEGIDARTVESYAAPAAILSRAMDYSEAEAASLLEDLLKGVDRTQQGRTDHEDLLSDILASHVRCGGKEGTLAVSQILESQSRFYEYNHLLEGSGVAVVATGEIFIGHQQVARSLLRDSDWRGKRLDQILSRINGSRGGRRRVGGQNLRGVYVPFEHQIEIREF